MTAFSFEARNVAVQRGERRLLSGFALTVQAGEVVHLVGPNGCGKTSLMRVMAGLVDPAEGEILWCGEPLASVRAAFCQNMAWLGHYAALKADLSLRENIEFDNALRLRHPPERIDAVLSELDLRGRESVMARGLSAGQRRRLALARVVLSNARLWLLDEPFTNLDVAGREHVLKTVSEHVRSGGSCVFAAHQDVELGGLAIRRLEWS